MDNPTEDRPLFASDVGARLFLLMAPTYFPIEEEDEKKRVPTTVRLMEAKHEDVELIAELWNQMEEELGRKRRRQWRASSVMERLIDVGVAGFWEQVGGRPEGKADRVELVRRTIERLKKSTHKK